MTREIKFRVWHKKNLTMSSSFDLNQALESDKHHPISDNHVLMRFTGLEC